MSRSWTIPLLLLLSNLVDWLQFKRYLRTHCNSIQNVATGGVVQPYRNGINSVGLLILNFLKFVDIMSQKMVQRIQIAASWLLINISISINQKAIKQVIPSCWNQTSFTSMLWRAGTKKSVSVVRYVSWLAVMVVPFLFSKKYGLMMSLLTKSHQVINRNMWFDFCVGPLRWKWASSEKINFF